MAKASHGIEYGSPNGKGKTTRAAAGRLCSEEGCSTVLSTYNQAAACWLHVGPSFRRTHERT